MTASHVVVAGATGYLGRHIVQRLCTETDVTVTAIARPLSKIPKLENVDRLSYAELDIIDSKSVGELLSSIKPTHVINASSYGVSPTETDFSQNVAVNTWGTYALMAGAAQAGAKRFIQIGSYFEYAPQNSEIREDDPIAPTSIYASTKAAASMLISDRRICGDMETVLARAFHLWGADEPAHRLTSQVIAACRSHRALDLTSGQQEKDFTYVRDAAKWLSALTLHTQQLPHNVYNIAGGKRCSVRDFVTSLAAELDGIDLMRFGAKPMPEREPPTGLADTSRLEALLGPLAITPLHDAIQETLDAAASL